MPTITLSGHKTPGTVINTGWRRDGSGYVRTTSSFPQIIDGTAFNSALRWGKWYFDNNYTVLDSVEYEVDCGTPELAAAIVQAEKTYGKLSNIRLVATAKYTSIIKEPQDPTSSIPASDELVGWYGNSPERTPSGDGWESYDVTTSWALSSTGVGVHSYIVSRFGDLQVPPLGRTRKVDLTHLSFSIQADYSEIPENKIIRAWAGAAGKVGTTVPLYIEYSHNAKAHTINIVTAGDRGSSAIWYSDAEAAALPTTRTISLNITAPGSWQGVNSPVNEQYTVTISPNAAQAHGSAALVPIKQVDWGYTQTTSPMPVAAGSECSLHLYSINSVVMDRSPLIIRPGTVFDQGVNNAAAHVTYTSPDRYRYVLSQDAGGGFGVVPLTVYNASENGIYTFPLHYPTTYPQHLTVQFESGPTPVIPKIVSAVVSSSTSTTYSEGGSGRITDGATWEATVVSNVPINGSDKYRIEISNITIGSSTGAVSTPNGYYLYTDGDTSNLGLYKGVTTSYPSNDRLIAKFEHILGGANNGTTSVTIKLVSGTGASKVVYDTATVTRTWPVNNSPVISANVPSVWMDSTKLFDVTKVKTALPRLRPGWPKSGIIQFEMKNVPNTSFKIGFNPASVSGVYVNGSGVEIPIDNLTVIPKASVVKLTHIGQQSEGSAVITLSDPTPSPSVPQRIEFLLIDGGIITDTEFNKTALASSN